MAKNFTIICEHGLTSATLSAWHDHDLNAVEEQAISDHIQSCSACQAYLQQVDAIVSAFQAQKKPVLTRNVLEELPVSTSHRWGRLARIQPRRRAVLQSIGAVAAVILVVVGFAAVFSRVAQNTIPQYKPLVWQAGVFPPGTRADPDNFIPDVAVTDGARAYLCILPRPSGASTDQPAQIWVSDNRAMSWTHTADLPTGALSGANQITSCRVTVDDANPDIAVANAQPSDSLTASITNSSFITFDSGVTWHSFSYGAVKDLSTWHNTMYICCAAGAGILAGTVTGDSVHSWRPITQQILAAHQYLGYLYVKPDTGALLAVAGKDGVSHLWVSKDGGARWTPIPAPAVPGYLAGYIVQQPIAGHPWNICAESYPPNTLATRLSGLTCTTNGGQSWQLLPVVAGTSKSDSAAVLAITSAGDILETDILPSKAIKLFTLPIGSTVWQSLGTMPSGAQYPQYVPSPAGGILWTIQPLDPSISPHVYTAAYP